MSSAKLSRVTADVLTWAAIAAERAADGVALSRRVAEWRQVDGAALVHAEEQRLTRSRRDALLGEEREEPGLGCHGEGDDAEEAARVLGEDGHRDAEDSSVGRFVDQVDAVLAIPGDGGGFGDRRPGLGGAARARDELPRASKTQMLA